MIRQINAIFETLVSARRASPATLWALGAAALSVATVAPSGAAVTDVGQYDAGKTANYIQTGSTSPTLAAVNPYSFSAEIIDGTTGTVQTSSTLTPPTGATGRVAFVLKGDGSGVHYEQSYSSASALNAAFLDGNYTFSIKTSTLNNYAATLALNGPYPTDIPTISGGSWISGDLIIDPTVSNTINWNTSRDLHLSFNVKNTSIGENTFNSGGGLPSSYTIAANALLPGQTYLAQLDFANGYVDTTQISGVTGATYYQNQTEFTIVTTPEPAASLILIVGSVGAALLSTRRRRA